MKAILVLTSTNPFYEEELKSLCEACHIEVVDVVIQKLEKINPATYIGKGKIEEIKLKLQDEMVIFDNELTPLQVKNLTDLLETEVTDRTDLILRIFDERAKTKEAKLQVEIARDQYLLPRLVGMQEHMSHQQGGSGFRGSGEKLNLIEESLQESLPVLEKNLLKSSNKDKYKDKEERIIKFLLLL